MRRKYSFCLNWLITSVFLLLLLPQCVFASDYEVVATETHEFEITRGTLLQFTVGYGNLNIIVWDQPTVQFHIKKWAKGGNRQKAEQKLEELQIEFSPGKNKLVIHQLNKGGNSILSGLFKLAGVKKDESTKVDFVVNVPYSVQLKIDKTSGFVTINGIHGNISLEQKNGTLEILNILAENMDLKLDDVQVKISNLNGPNGIDPHMKFSIKKGELVLETSRIIRLVADSKEADVYLIGNEIRSGEIEIKAGDLFLNSDLNAQTRIRARSESGDMYLIVPDSPAAKIFAETVLGVIRSAQQWEIKKSGGVSILNYNGSQDGVGVCEFISDIGDIYFQQKWH